VSSTLSILMLHGDAEWRLLGQAGDALQAGFQDREVRFTTAWTTRSDLLDAEASPAPPSLRARGLLPATDARDLLKGSYDLVLLSVLADAVLPLLCGPEGAFVPHRSLVDGWSAEDKAMLDSVYTEGHRLAPSESARALEPVIRDLQDRGAAVAVCTIFRHAGTPLEHRLGGTHSLRERIRETNVELARLSHRMGCFVLDLDRTLAHEGGGPLQTDCFGGSGRAEELALDELFALVLEAVPSIGEAGSAT
jgi:hypothetical protein